MWPGKRPVWLNLGRLYNILAIRAVNLFFKAARVPVRILSRYPGTRSKITAIFSVAISTQKSPNH